MVVASPRTGSDPRRTRRPATTVAPWAISPVRIWGPSGSRDMGGSEEFRRSRKERSRSPSSVGARWIGKAVTPASASAEIASRASELGPSVRYEELRTDERSSSRRRPGGPGADPGRPPPGPADRPRGPRPGGRRLRVPTDPGRSGEPLSGERFPGEKGTGEENGTSESTGYRGADRPARRPDSPRAPLPRFPSGGGGPTPPPGAPATSGPDAGLGSRSAGGVLDPPTFRLRHGEDGDDRSGATPPGGTDREQARSWTRPPGSPPASPARANRRTASGS